MTKDTSEAFSEISLGADNPAYDIINRMDEEYAGFLKGLYVDGTFGREGALDRKTKEFVARDATVIEAFGAVEKVRATRKASKPPSVLATSTKI